MSQKRIQPFHTGLSTKNSAKDKSALDLLGAYIMSDDSEDEKKEKTSESLLDSKVSSFLKEIEDLDMKTSSSQKSKRKDNLNFSNNSSKNEETLNWGLWKQCKDQSTGYPYYWNTKTNEVTWSLPEGIQKKSINTKIKVENDIKVSTAQKRSNGTEQKYEPLNKKQKTTEFDNKNTFASKDLDMNLVSKIQQKRLKLKLERQMNEHSKQLKKEEELSTKTTEKALDILASQKIPDKKSSIESKIISKVSAKLSNTFGELLKETREESRKLQRFSHDNKEEQANQTFQTQKKNVNKTSQVIQDKLKCLNATKNQISICQKLYIELQVRLLDWNSGQLSDEYMTEKLQNTEEALKEYEKSLAPKGWKFLWNR